METKTAIWIGIFVGSTIGGLIGTWVDHGNGLGIWTVLLSTFGGIAGIWAGYNYANNQQVIRFTKPGVADNDINR